MAGWGMGDGGIFNLIYELKRRKKVERERKRLRKRRRRFMRSGNSLLLWKKSGPM
jgi:hypothetical protein